MDLKYIVTAADLATVPHGRTIVDFHANLWQRTPGRTLWTDGTQRERSHAQMITMRGPVYVLPEDFPGELNLDDLSDAEPGDYLMDKFGDAWGKSTAGRWILPNYPGPGAYTKTSAEMLALFAPLLPAPRPGDIYIPMSAAAQQEEARPAPMANTHRAVIETSVPPGLELIASGAQDFCTAVLDKWVRDHPLGEFEVPLVLGVVPTTARPVGFWRRLWNGLVWG